MQKFLLILLMVSASASPLVSQVQELLKVKHFDDPASRFLVEQERTSSVDGSKAPVNFVQKREEFARHMNTLATESKGVFTQEGNELRGLKFDLVGPRNIAGRTRAFAVDRANSSVMLAGGVTGGMWRSIDAGKSWTRCLPFGSYPNVSCIIQDPRQGKSATWYMGTGEILSTSERRTDTVLRTICTGTGMYKSIDNGISWTQLGTAEEILPPNSLVTSLQGVWSVIVDPKATKDVLLAACFGGILRSEDGGLSWTKVLGRNEPDSLAFGTDIVVSSDGIFYAALGATDKGSLHSSVGLWRSTDGVNWSRVSSAFRNSSSVFRRPRLALAPTNSNVLYIFLQTPTNWARRYTSFGQRHGLYKYTFISSDGVVESGRGKLEDRSAWMAHESVGLNTLAGYCMALAVSPANENHVALAGTDAWYSTNGFADTIQMFKIGGYPYRQAPQFLHPDCHSLIFAPGDGNTLFCANDGGVSLRTSLADRREDIWTPLNNGRANTQLYAVAQAHSVANDFIIGGFQDNSCWYSNSPSLSRSWSFGTGGDGCGVAVRKNLQPVFGTSQFGYAFSLIPREPDYDKWAYLTPNALDTITPHFVTQVILSPSEDTLFMPIRNRLFYLTDLDELLNPTQGDYHTRWRELPDIGMTIPQSRYITATRTGTDNSGTFILMGTNDGHLYRRSLASVDSVVEEIGATALSQRAFISGIAIDPRDAKTFVVTYSNYNAQSIYRTTDGGESWVSIAGNIESFADTWGPSFRCVEIVRMDSVSAIVVGTSSGLFETEKPNGAQTKWTQQGAESIGNLTVESMDYRALDGRLVLGTHGGGIFTTKISAKNFSSVAVGEPHSNTLIFSLPYPNPASGSTKFMYSVDFGKEFTITLFDLNGKKTRELVRGIGKGAEQIFELHRQDFANGRFGYVKLETTNPQEDSPITRLVEFE